MEYRYCILRNGNLIKGSQGSLDRVIRIIRWLETDLDRSIQHSPFTVGMYSEEKDEKSENNRCMIPGSIR